MRWVGLHSDAEGGVALDANPRGVMPHGVAPDTARDANAEVVRDPDDVMMVLWVSERADGEENTRPQERVSERVHAYETLTTSMSCGYQCSVPTDMPDAAAW